MSTFNTRTQRREASTMRQDIWEPCKNRGRVSEPFPTFLSLCFISAILPNPSLNTYKEEAQLKKKNAAFEHRWKLKKKWKYVGKETEKTKTRKSKISEEDVKGDKWDRKEEEEEKPEEEKGREWGEGGVMKQY